MSKTEKVKIIIGNKYGRLTVISEAEKNKNGTLCFLCLCECGNQIVTRKYGLLDGRTKSCGCLRKETTFKSRFKDLTGQKFGRLTVISKTENIGRRIAWICICDCGREKTVIGEGLTQGKTRSCGCLRDDTEIIDRRNGIHSTADSCAYQVYKSYQHNAKLRTRNFSLAFDDFKRLTSSDCFYCGTPPKQIFKGTKNGESYFYNGIDRKNNAVGYEIENCIPCCSLCNTAKNTTTYEDFISWLDRITKFRTCTESI